MGRGRGASEPGPAGGLWPASVLSTGRSALTLAGIICITILYVLLYYMYYITSIIYYGVLSADVPITGTRAYAHMRICPCARVRVPRAQVGHSQGGVRQGFRQEEGGGLLVHAGHGPHHTHTHTHTQGRTCLSMRATARSLSRYSITCRRRKRSGNRKGGSHHPSPPPNRPPSI
jgi:hypothetical protein